MQKKYVTMKDIARKLGLSITTVSKAFKNHPDLNSNTRDLVLRTAEEMGFVKNVSASVLRENQSRIIGVLMASASNPFYNAIFNGIESVASQNGYQIIYANAKRDARAQDEAIRTFLGRRVDGLILAPVDPVRQAQDGFGFSGAKGVLAFHREGGAYDMVCSAEYEGGLAATRHLLEQGCRRIVMLNDFFEHPGSEDRARGYRKALEEARIEARPEWQLYCQEVDPDHRINEGYRAVLEAVKQGLEFDGLFGFNDIITYGAFKALNELGKHIPRQVAIVGYDDLDYSAVLTPPLSSVNFPKYEMGARITHLLLERLENPDVPARIEQVETRLVIRTSSLRNPPDQ